MKKKHFATSKDKKDWIRFTKQMGNVSAKESDLPRKNNEINKVQKLDLHKKLENKTLAIIEPRPEYKKDKTWSFWKVAPHNFDDCVQKSWKNFSINSPIGTKHLQCDNYPYQSIDSGLFYKKIVAKLKENKNRAITDFISGMTDRYAINLYNNTK